MTTEPRAEASLSVAALHLLLATHEELDDLPVEWISHLNRTIEAFITVRHTDGERATRLIAAALELDVDENDFSDKGIPTRSLRVEGRWGGARWFFTTYVDRAVAGLHVLPAGVAGAGGERS